MGKGESILVVDDVKQQREIASRMLKKLGYNVLSVPSGEEAVIYLQENTADLLVLDMMIWDRTGWRPIKKFSNFIHGRKPSSPVDSQNPDRSRQPRKWVPDPI